MTASPYDSPIWRGVFHDADLAPLFTDTATLRAALLVMGALALAQAEAGIVPEVSAKAIQRAAMEVQIDPSALIAKNADTSDPIAALVERFKAEMKAPEHAKWVHYASDTALTGATGLSLRLRQAFKILANRGATLAVPNTYAFHGDPIIRAALAQGLGLATADDRQPTNVFRDVSYWISNQAEGYSAQSPLQSAIRHHILHLNTTIQTAPDDAATLIQMMTLPQMVLGLGKLLN